jgi:cytochrome c2
LCDPVTAIVAGSVLGAAAQVYTGSKQASAAKAAAAQAKTSAANAAARQDVETNRANARSPDLAAIMGRNAAGASGGVGSTMLTGPSGVDMSQLTLGKQTLLGA